MARGKVVLVPFPFDDLSTAKVRPVVCLTDPIGPTAPIGPHRHVILSCSGNLMAGLSSGTSTYF